MSRGLGALQRGVCEVLGDAEGYELPLREVRRRLGQPDRLSLRRGIRGLLQRGLEKRLEVLERSAGRACPKCSGVLLTVVNGKLRSATRHGEPMGGEERSLFEVAGPRCPACGTDFLAIRVPSEIPRV